ncbi:MAG: TonB-dependent receptor, partial [Rikenellaceae bacterium]
YRNDLIVRGGSPSENAFFLDGFPIPNINHFSTQGAGGGPVSVVNADLIREVEFYTGAFPADQGGALSSMLDIELRSGNREEQRFKATLGASEVALSGSGHFTSKCNYIFSARQSYLQFLFKLLGLPLLPNYIDLLGKVEYSPTSRDKITFLSLNNFDDMTINMDNSSTFTQYIAGYIPHIKQQSYTAGVKWQRYLDNGVFTLLSSHSTLANNYLKYEGNDESRSEGVIYSLKSSEGRSYLKGGWQGKVATLTLGYGAELNYTTYRMDSFQRLFTGGYDTDIAYDSRFGMVGWGAYVDGEWMALDNRLTLSGGVRLDGVNYNSKTAQIWRNISPRIGAEYALPHQITLKASGGIYYQLPPLTALGYVEDGERVNSSLTYMNVRSIAAGMQWQYREELILSVEGFYKRYNNIPLSIEDGISLSDKGNDYGIVGNEALTSSASGRAYGAEFMVRWSRPSQLSVVSSLTLFRSLSRTSPDDSYYPSAWDNRFIINTSGTYYLPKNWSIGAKISAIGGSPYTPYDEDLSSYVIAWDLRGQPYYDYSQHNTLRLEGYAQLDIRLDKSFYFERWSLGLYLDIQNITYSTLQRPDIYMSSGVIRNPSAALEEQRYYMGYLEDINGAVIPTLGVTIEF